MKNRTPTPDADAILLLCATFGQKGTSEIKPLNISEYERLAGWLREERLRPFNLLDPDLDISSPRMPISQERIQSLLRRGVTLSLALEKWQSQGIWILSRADSDYPKRLKEYLQHQAPPILYGVGNMSNLSKGGLAIVGSRNVDEEGTEYTQRVTQACVDSEIQVVSGGAKGVDRTAMVSALEVGGTVVGVMADSLSKEAVSVKYREGLQSQKLTLISTYDPDMGFNVGNAMGRNKYIYALAEYALVVCSDFKNGGTWAGATEALEKHKNTQVFVKAIGNISEGNSKLLENGAKPFPESPWRSNLRKLLNDSLCFPEILINDSSGDLISSTEDDKKHSISNAKSDELLINTINTLSIPSSFYDFFLLIIPKYLTQPSTLRSISKSMNNDIKESQLKEYLDRAVKNGHIQNIKQGTSHLYSLPVEAPNITQLDLSNLLTQ